MSTPITAEKYEHTLEENRDLADKAMQHELPLLVYGTINVDGVELNYLERRPPHFDARKKYPGPILPVQRARVADGRQDVQGGLPVAHGVQVGVHRRDGRRPRHGLHWAQEPGAGEGRPGPVRVARPDRSGAALGGPDVRGPVAPGHLGGGRTAASWR